MTLFSPPFKAIALWLGMSLPLCLVAQTGAYWPHPQWVAAMEREAMADGSRDHLSIRPLRLKYVPVPPNLVDTSALILGSYGGKMWLPPDSNRWAIGVMPVFDFMAGYETGRRQGALYRAEAGPAVHARYGSRWSLYFDVRGGTERPPAYIGEFVERRGILPGSGRNRASKGDPAYLDPTARVSYSPSPHFEFELGYGTHFFGFGRQSLLLSDIAANYPYFKIITDVWNVRYVNLFSAYRDIRQAPSNPDTYRRKYSATHYLSWAIGPRWNVGLFESIIWQAGDTLSDRGFDPNYLNPIIFLRPVEYSVGSPDNALMGLDIAFKAGPRFSLYGQVVIDEFLLSEFRERRGWWANKWGGQIGVKTWGWIAPGLDLQLEYNTARPFTYTHGSALQSFTHFNEPLAHRLGTNFHEGSAYAHYEKGRKYISAQWTVARYGRDRDSLNLGGDIFRSYVDPARIYGNHTTQGATSTLFYQNIQAGYIVNRGINLRVAVGYTYRHLHAPSAADLSAPSAGDSHFFTLSLGTDIYRRHRDF